tara:strand:+ start:83 stop:733 length:651 start_codon:yes stop_codon:yes gene_type:complete
MHYLIYKITNDETGMWYIGAHKTKDINDGYMGSGILLNLAFEQYGVDNFTKEILYDLPTEELMYKKEEELVEQDNPQTYNMTEGGHGGWSHVNTDEYLEQKRMAGKKGNDALKKRLLEDKSFKDYFSKKTSETMKKLWKESPELFANSGYDWTGKKHTESTKEKMSNTHKKNGHQVGTKNSQYGKMWITNGNQSTRIVKNNPIPEGWYKGRVINPV